MKALIFSLIVLLQGPSQKMELLGKKVVGNVYLNIDSANVYLDQLDSMAHVHEDSLHIGHVFRFKGIIADITSNYTEAQINYYRAQEIYESLDNQLNVAKTRYNIALMHMKLNNDSLALVILKKDIEAYEAVNDTFNVINSYITTGYILNRNGAPDSALQLLKKAYYYSIQHRDTIRIASANNLIGDSYLQMRKPQRAKEYYRSTIKLIGLDGSPWNLGYSNMRLAESSLTLKEFKLCIEYANKALEYYAIIEEKTRIKDVYGIMAEAHENMGDFESAYRLHKRFKMLNDSLFNVQKNKQIATLETQYETEKKDTEIASLSQQAQIQALELSQRNTQLVVAGVALLLIVLAGFIFYQQRKYKHQQAVSDIEQRMLRLQMNPHFIFNALSSIQNYILQSDTKESVKYLAKFGKLMRQILEHSREEFITIEEEVDMLTNYLQIQQLRFGGAFDYQIKVSEELDQSAVKIPPLFAQPLVENAIEHGLAGIEDGLVTISFSKTDDGVSLQVADNGRGMNVESKSISEHKSLASVITRERLDILSSQFRSKFSFNYKTLDQGTQASLVVPIKVI